MRILLAGIGNIFQGDDAFGCEVAAELAKQPLPEGVTVRDFGIRSYDLAYAIMEPYDAVVLIDAMPRGEAPGTLFLFEPDTAGLSAAEPTDAHSMNPVAALQLVRALGGQARNLYVIGCEPALLDAEEFGLSGPVRAAVPGAVEMAGNLVRQLLEKEPATAGLESNHT